MRTASHEMDARKPIHTEQYRWEFGSFVGPPMPKYIDCLACHQRKAIPQTHGVRRYCDQCRGPHGFWRGRKKRGIEQKQGKCALYRHWDANGQLLYVGISVNPFDRTKDHRHSANWFYEVATITVEFFETTAKAAQAELSAIRTEGPKHNKSGVMRAFTLFVGPQ
jgi:hypothetical protein